VETTALKPTWASDAQSKAEAHKAALWEMKTIFPGLACLSAKVAQRLIFGLITPKLLGPMMRMPYFF
jgi:hypothetical protein